MDILRVRSNPREHRRTIAISIRITPDIRRWLAEKQISPTRVFFEAIKELGYKRERR